MSVGRLTVAAILKAMHLMAKNVDIETIVTITFWCLFTCVCVWLAIPSTILTLSATQTYMPKKKKKPSEFDASSNRAV